MEKSFAEFVNGLTETCKGVAAEKLKDVEHMDSAETQRALGDLRALLRERIAEELTPVLGSAQQRQFIYAVANLDATGLAQHNQTLDDRRGAMGLCELDAALKTLQENPVSTEEGDANFIQNEAREIAEALATAWASALDWGLVIHRVSKCELSEILFVRDTVPAAFHVTCNQHGLDSIRAHQLLHQAIRSVLRAGESLQLLRSVVLHRMGEDYFMVQMNAEPTEPA